MLGDKGAKIGARAGKNNPSNSYVNQFMKEVRDKAKPVDLDHPQDEGLADGGKRMENIRKASRICSSLISVRRC